MEEIITYRPAFRPPIQQPATALLYPSSEVPSLSQVPSSSSGDEDDNCDDENGSRESANQGDNTERANYPISQLLIGPIPPAGSHPQQNPHAANQAHIQQQQQREVQMQHQAALRRVRKPTDTEVPEEMDEWDPMVKELCGQIRRMQAAELKMDTIMARKRLQMQDRYNKPERREQTLRISISNTVANQPWQQPPFTAETFDFDTMGEEPTYKLTVIGVLQPDPLDEHLSDEDKPVKEKSEEEKLEERQSTWLTHFFKRITVDVERPADHPHPIQLADWKRSETTDRFPRFNMERKGDCTFNVVISLYREEKPERFRLSQALEATLDMEEASRAEVLQYIWLYIKFFNLQEDDEKRRIRCDDNLKKVFGVDVVYFPQLAERILPHLHPLPPYELRYTVHIDKKYDYSTETIYNVQVAVDDPICKKIWKMTHSPKHLAELRQIDEYDDKLAVEFQKTHRSVARRNFLYNHSMDPVGFTKNWTESQMRDLEIMLATGPGSGTDMAYEKGGEDSVWVSPAVLEAVRGLLGKPQRPAQV